MNKGEDMTEFTSVGNDLSVTIHDELCPVTTYSYTGYVKDACQCALIAKVREGVAVKIEEELEKIMPPVDDAEYAVYNAMTWVAQLIRDM
jgi:hypothetical protein